MKKGQLSFVNLFWFVIIVFLAVIFTPILNAVITSTDFYQTSSGINRYLMDAVVPFLWIGVIMTFFIYASPQRNVMQ